MKTLIRITLALALIAGAVMAMSARAAGVPAMQIDFNGQHYVWRWAQDGQYEFTPAGQEDLRLWKDMLTFDVHEKVTSGVALADLANTVLGRYRAAGKVLTTDSTPRTDQRPAEHFVSAVLARPQFLEAVFARFLLADGVGMVVVYSHRVYGNAAGDAMSRWLEKNGSVTQRALMRWRVLPTPAALRALAAHP